MPGLTTEQTRLLNEMMTGLTAEQRRLLNEMLIEEQTTVVRSPARITLPPLATAVGIATVVASVSRPCMQTRLKARIGCHDEGSRRAWRSRRSRIGIKFIDPMNHTYGV